MWLAVLIIIALALVGFVAWIVWACEIADLVDEARQ